MQEVCIRVMCVCVCVWQRSSSAVVVTQNLCCAPPPPSPSNARQILHNLHTRNATNSIYRETYIGRTHPLTHTHILEYWEHIYVHILRIRQMENCNIWSKRMHTRMRTHIYLHIYLRYIRCIYVWAWLKQKQRKYHTQYLNSRTILETVQPIYI